MAIKFYAHDVGHC